MFIINLLVNLCAIIILLSLFSALFNVLKANYTKSCRAMWGHENHSFYLWVFFIGETTYHTTLDFRRFKCPKFWDVSDPPTMGYWVMKKSAFWPFKFPHMLSPWKEQKHKFSSKFASTRYWIDILFVLYFNTCQLFNPPNPSAPKIQICPWISLCYLQSCGVRAWVCY